MMEWLRDMSRGWVAKILLALLVLSFAVWGIADVFRSDLTGATIVSAGDQKIDGQQYRFAYEREINVLSRQFGRRLTTEQAQALGVESRVLSTLVTGAVLDAKAADLSLGISKDRLANITAEEQAFFGVDGVFDRNQFRRALANAGMTESDYFDSIGKVARRQQIVEAVTEGARVPNAFLEAFSVFEAETRDVTYFTIPTSQVLPVTEPSDDQLKTYFAENGTTYRIPEYRAFSYVKLEPEDILDADAISDEDVRKDYEDNIVRYTDPETRVFEQIVFSSQEAADKAAADISAGKSFEDILEAQGKSIEDAALGTYNKSAFPISDVVDDAFALELNVPSKALPGTFGPVIIRATSITPEVVAPFENVSANIRNSLAVNEATRVLLDVHDAVEDSMGGGDTLQEAALKQKLKVVDVPAIAATAQTPEGDVLSELPNVQELVRSVFETEVAIENPPLNVGRNGFVWYELKSITDARDPELSEVRAKVIEDWKAEEATRLLAAKAEEVRKSVEDGQSMDDAATALSISPAGEIGLSRDNTSSPMGADAVRTAFTGPKGSVFAAPATGGTEGYVVMKIDVVNAPPADIGTIEVTQKERLESAVTDDLLEQLVSRLEGEYPVSYNQQAAQAAISYGRGGYGGM